MDIVTHGAIGLILSGPFWETMPVEASLIVLGSTLPDADVLCRLRGRSAFLRAHQTWSHSLVGIAIGSALVTSVLAMFGVNAPWAFAALAGAMLLHAGLDATNTYGTAFLLPFSRKRYCAAWIFFIDLPLALVTALGLGGLVVCLLTGAGTEAALAWGFAYFLGGYVTLRALAKRRVRRLAPEGTVFLAPAAFLPWRYLGIVRAGDKAQLFRISAIDGRVWDEGEVEILDPHWEPTLWTIPDYRTMRGLSSAYHVVSAEPGDAGTRLRCRDLRIRHFGTRFGELTVEVDPDGRVVSSSLHA